jgi:predicted alpha/beta superfamily hydrolase
MPDLSRVKKDAKEKVVRLADMMKATARQFRKTQDDYRRVKDALVDRGMGDSFSQPITEQVKSNVRRGWQTLKEMWDSRRRSL